MPGWNWPNRSNGKSSPTASRSSVFDAPGVGESTGYQWPRRIPGIARTVERLLDAVGHQQVDVLGVSLDGVIAQQVAHQAPRRVRRLVLAATGHPPAPINDENEQDRGPR